MASIITGAVLTGILRPTLTVLDTIQFFVALLLALPFAVVLVLTKGVKSLVLMDKLHKFLCKFPCGQTLFSLMVGIASPYNASIRPRFIKLEKDECKACMQDRPWLRNPFASLHAIALANLAEMTSGVGMLTAAQYEKGLRVIPVKVECEYHAKARGPVTATAKCTLPSEKNDGVVPYTVHMHNKKGELVATATVHWKFSYKENNPRNKLQGVVFPVTSKGDRSTTETAKKIFAAAIQGVDPEAAEKVQKEKSWRFAYNKHLVTNCITAAKSEQKALSIAQAGLDAMYKSFDFVGADGKAVKFDEALKKGVNRFHTHTIVGTKPKPAGGAKITVPYKNYETNKEVLLEGEALLKQIDVWVAYGTIEPDCGEAIKAVVRNPSWCDLSGQVSH